MSSATRHRAGSRRVPPALAGRRLGVHAAWCLLGWSLLSSCHPGGRPPAPAAVDHPRCVASDPDGNQVICAASPRAYDRDGCACANRQGRIFYGRVEEYPRR